MLMGLRRAAHKSIFKYAIFGVLILSFGLWGVADMFIPGSGDNEIVMSAGSRDFSYIEVERAYRRELRSLGMDVRSTGSSDLRRVLDLTLHRLSLNALQAQRVSSLGVLADRGSVLRLIRGNPTFQDSFGRFDSLTFGRFLSLSGLGESDYIDLLAEDLGSSYWLSSLRGATFMPVGLASAYDEYLRQVRELFYVEISYDSVSVDLPGEAVLRDYYGLHRESYRIGERRDISVVDVSLSSLSGDLLPTESDLRSVYDSGAYSGDLEERRDISFIVFGDEFSALSAYESGGSLESMGLSFGLDVQRFSGRVRSDIADESLSARAFSGDETGVIGEPFASAFGWVLLRVDNISAARPLSFEEVRDEIYADLVDERAGAIIYDKALALEEVMAAGATLEEAALRLGLSVRGYAVVAGDNSLAADITAEAFALPLGETGTLIERESADGLGSFFMVRVDGIEESHIAGFEDSQALLRRDYLRAERERILVAAAESVKSGETSLSDFASQWGRKLARAEVSFHNDDGDFPRFLRSQSFRSHAIGHIEFSAGDDSFILAQSKSVRLQTLEDEQAGLGDRVLRRLAENMVALAYEESLRRHYKITRNAEALEAIIIGSGLSGAN